MVVVMGKSAPRINIMGDPPSARIDWLTHVMRRAVWDDDKGFTQPTIEGMPFRHCGTATQEGVEPGSTRTINPWFNWHRLEGITEEGSVRFTQGSVDLVRSMLNTTGTWTAPDDWTFAESSDDIFVAGSMCFSWFFAGVSHDDSTDMYRIELIPALYQLTPEEGINPSQIANSYRNAHDTLVLSRLRFGILIDPSELTPDNTHTRELCSAVSRWKPGDLIFTRHTSPGRVARMMVGHTPGQIHGTLSEPTSWGHLAFENFVAPNIQTLIAQYHALDYASEHGDNTIWGTEATPEEANENWVHTWCDKRRTIRVGITADINAYWHGYSRCHGCNGEVEYRFDKGREETTLKCPHCDAQAGIVIQFEGVI